MESDCKQHRLEEKDSVNDTYAVFSIFSDALIPDKITQQIGIIPTRSWSKEQILYHNEGGKPITRDKGAWILSSKDKISSLYLEEHIKYLLDILEPASNILKSLYINRQDYIVWFWLNWNTFRESSYFYLNSETSRRMAELSQFIQYSICYEK